MRIFSIILILCFALACSAQVPQPDPEIVGPTSVETLRPKPDPSPTPKKKNKEPTEKKKSSSLIHEVEQKYAKASTVELKITKKLKLKVLDQERKQTGVLELQKPGKFRLSLEGDEKTLVVSDNKTIWVVNYPTDPDFDNTTRIVRSKDPKKVQAQALMGFLLGKNGLLANYKVKSEKPNEKEVVYELESLKKGEEISTLFVNISTDKKEITSLQYSDKLENITTIEISNTKFNPKFEAGKFAYSVPKGAEVTDL